MFYEDIFRQFNLEKVKYMVVGGIAVNLHGVPRTTQDLDLFIDLEKENILKVVSKLLDMGYSPRLPVNPEDLADENRRNEWINQRNLTAFTFFNINNPALEIDLIIDTPIAFDHADGNKIIKNADDVEIPLISIEDLIKLKEPIGRKQDMSDIAMLRKILELEND